VNLSPEADTRGAVLADRGRSRGAETRGNGASVRWAGEYQRQEGTPLSHLKQTVTFCRTKDGINLAIASVGHGPVLVRAAHSGTNIEYDLQNPLIGPYEIGRPILSNHHQVAASAPTPDRSTTPAERMTGAPSTSGRQLKRTRKGVR
jgi:hypothetical protein